MDIFNNWHLLLLLLLLLQLAAAAVPEDGVIKRYILDRSSVCAFLGDPMDMEIRAREGGHRDAFYDRTFHTVELFG